MTSFQRIRKFLAGIAMLLAGLIMILEPVNGYYIVALFISTSMLLSGIKSLVYYFTMARHMVGGRSILYSALVLTDLGFFTMTAITIPRFYLICHLLISHAFSGLVDIMKAVEDKKLSAPSWRMSFVMGLGNLVTAVVAFMCLLNEGVEMVTYVYCAGLTYSALMHMVSACRKTAIVYIP